MKLFKLQNIIFKLFKIFCIIHNSTHDVVLLCLWFIMPHFHLNVLHFMYYILLNYSFVVLLF